MTQTAQGTPIRAAYFDRIALDVRSSYTNRNRRCDAYFIVYACPPDAMNAMGHQWVLRYEVARGSKRPELTDYANKDEARAAGAAWAA